MKITTKLYMIILALFIFLALFIGVNGYFATPSEQFAENSRSVSAVMAIKAKEMQISVIQVQQWLTDISATRAAQGFDDGFKKAELGIGEVAQNSTEAARSVTSMSSSIEEISVAADLTAEKADQTQEASNVLVSIAASLSGAIKRFKI